MKNNFIALKNMNARNLPVILYSLLIGLLSGLIIVAYRFILGYAETLSLAIYSFIKGHWYLILVWFIGLILLGLLVGGFIKKNDMIVGSGIPQVKGLLMGYFKDHWVSTLFMKFIGGTVSVFAGLSVGREGPSIQLGSCIAQGITKHLKCSTLEKKILIAGGSCAGLAAAFNAPLAGVLFVFEEIFKYFSPLILLAAMGSAIVADFVSKQIFGIEPIFNFDFNYVIPLDYYWILILLGIVLGVLGVVYNTSLIGLQKYSKRLTFLTPTRKVILTFLLAGIVGLTFPILLGGGHHIMESLTAELSIKILMFLLISKFLFSILSFNSGVPGGIFFPLLVMGGLIGAIFSHLTTFVFHIDSNFFYNFMIFGMAGFFTAIVRAPITGIVLITEMTGSFHYLLPLTITSITAYVVADLLKSLPIYDSLLENMLTSKEIIPLSDPSEEKIMVQSLVQHESLSAGKSIRDIPWPDDTLLVSIKRREQWLVPNGKVVLEAGDELIFITNAHNEYLARESIHSLTTIE